MKDEDHQEKDYYLWAVLAVCVIAHIAFSFVGWNNSLCDLHGFRQTQTAISAYYMLKEGFGINYATPVLGKPWFVPLEFPLYQWLVALVVRITGIPLDQAGRSVSLLFFYLSLFMTSFLLRPFLRNKSHLAIFLSVLLASPFYIFWSRAFMIESLALFLGICFLVEARKAAICKKKSIAAAAVLAGALAGSVKITTLAVFYIPAVFLFYRSWLESDCRASRCRGRDAAYVFFIFITPLLLSAGWAFFADRQRSLNPMAGGFLTSGALKTWILGSLQRRFSAAQWLAIWRQSRSIFWFESSSFAIIWCVFFLAARSYRKEAFLCFLVFVSGPLFFLNLYRIHEYYFYANAVFFLLSLGFLISALLTEKRWRKLTRFVIFPVILLMMYGAYAKSYYFMLQNTDNRRVPAFAQKISGLTREKDVLLIYGFDWSAELPYYAQRRALMDRRELPLDDLKFQRALRELRGERIGAMVIGGARRFDHTFIQERIAKFNLSPRPVLRDHFADVYAVNRRESSGL